MMTDSDRKIRLKPSTWAPTTSNSCRTSTVEGARTTPPIQELVRPGYLPTSFCQLRQARPRVMVEYIVDNLFSSVGLDGGLSGLDTL